MSIATDVYFFPEQPYAPLVEKIGAVLGIGWHTQHSPLNGDWFTSHELMAEDPPGPGPWFMIVSNDSDYGPPSGPEAFELTVTGSDAQRAEVARKLAALSLGGRLKQTRKGAGSG
jgi:hypothetical protein